MRVADDLRAEAVIEALLRGDERGYIGEPVSLLDHSLQCAALARAARAPGHEILAALFHDIGHLIAPAGTAEMDGLGIVDHEHVGAAWLRDYGFEAQICELVSSHVQAKRYLALRKPGYHENLSPASRGTLAFQGGVMSELEARAFEADAQFAAKIRLRIWDEAAKDPGCSVPSVLVYVQRVREHLEGRAA